MPKHIDIVFDGPPGPEAGRFVEVEDAAGKSINFGKWMQRPDGYWVLRIDDDGLADEIERREAGRVSLLNALTAVARSTSHDDAVRIASDQLTKAGAFNQSRSRPIP